MAVPSDQSITAGPGFPRDDKSKRCPGAAMGAIRDATQGYFEIDARGGDSGGGWGESDTPYEKVRVVTAVHLSLGQGAKSGTPRRRPRPRVQKLAPSVNTTASSVKPSIEGPSTPT